MEYLNEFDKLDRAVFKSAPPERNEHFLPGRMAYLIELEDEMAESDIPTTVLRSKVDCPGTQLSISNTCQRLQMNIGINQVWRAKPLCPQTTSLSTN